MQEYLFNHAVNNVWCNPDQDNQLIFAAKKISARHGVLNHCTVMQRTLKLPQAGKRFHVYQVGQMSPRAIGLLPIDTEFGLDRWVSFSEIVQDEKLQCNIYTAAGVNIPKYISYYMFTRERNLIFAVLDSTNLNVDQDLEQVYLRLYANAYFQTSVSDPLADGIKIHGKDVVNTAEILELQTLYLAYKAIPGYPTVYCNGYIVDAVDLINIQIGDSVELIYDSSVKRVVTWPIRNLHTFTSELDQVYKYLLHDSAGNNESIDYHDDIDIYVIHNTSPTRFKGYYFPKNSPKAHRMVTHRDYSVSVEYVQWIASQLSDNLDGVPLNYLDLKIMAVIRKSGYNRPLIYDDNRIFELYKLPEDKVVQAMTGVNSTLDVWQCSSLEKSAYTELMRTPLKNITTDLIQRAYGYNAIASYFAATPTKTAIQSGFPSATVPVGLRVNSTIYSYDVDGILLGSHQHPYGTTVESIYPQTKLIEGLVGTGTYTPDVRFGSDNIDLPVTSNYRVYMSYMDAGISNEVWTDITGSNLYTVVGTKLVWQGAFSNQLLMVRTDATFLEYELDLLPTNGNYFFTLSEQEDRGDGIQNRVLPVPLGDLDIFLNGKSLINDLGYVLDFPKVMILDKKNLLQPAMSTVQKIRVRYTGFCNKDLSPSSVSDYGFIEHGFLSNNNRYDIRDDKVLRITVDGGTRHRSDLLFSEDHDGVDITNSKNGMPYQIKDIVVPIRQLVSDDTYSLRDKSLVIDNKVSNYMSIKKPQAIRTSVSAIAQKYHLVSPFFASIIEDMVTDHISTLSLQTVIDDNGLLAICKPYEHLLKYDPINESNKFDFRYVEVHPHLLYSTLNISLHQYRFLLRIVKLYGNNRIEPSPFLTFNL